jgi:hypothetical protein
VQIQDYHGEKNPYNHSANDTLAHINTDYLTKQIQATTAFAGQLAVPIANNVPVANNQSVIMDEDTAAAITLTATDVDGGDLAWTIVTTPTQGTLTGVAPELTFTPDQNYNGADSFTFKVNDGKVDSNIATVSLNIDPTLERRIYLPLILYNK